MTKTAPTEPFHSSGSKTSSTSTSVPAKKARNLSVEAAKRWKTTSLAGYSASQWLVVNSDITGSVTSLNCSVCNAYAEHIKGMKNFSTVWAYAGPQTFDSAMLKTMLVANRTRELWTFT